MPRMTSAELRACLPEGHPAAPAPTSGRRAGGAAAQRSGLDFESRLDGFHRQYFASGRAAIQRLNLPTVPAGVPGQPMLRRVAGGSGVDFWGAAMIGGVLTPLVVEAKHTAGRDASLAIVQKNAGLHIDQLRYMAELRERLGVLVIVLWESDQQVGVLLPNQVMAAWRTVEGCPAIGTKANSIGRIPRSRFRWLEPGDLDWLAVLDW